MPYHVQQHTQDDEWKTLYSEETAKKANLLMLGLSVKSRLGGGQYIDLTGLRVAWVGSDGGDAQQDAHP